ncbi:hypothetical protein OOZ15_14275 [Galbibacter sp. EGI 63066]|uniref:fibronectin type III domain-containing protein n=1 Tax=Galbibacter sp. EGI 63066 TaxID=2993559 RepID=UPI002249908F|nr:hypothetical protein [Galbibacter sp. EGI 63066]MCX2681115.1 hypothetical protein [Galbibacter sp. EGI 63066]
MKDVLIHTRYCFAISLFIFIVGCSRNDDNPPPGPPEAAILIFPEQNSECTTGIVSTTDPNKSTITFEWSEAKNADSYRITIRNLETNATQTYTANTTTQEAVLDRATPYAWQITSLKTTMIETTDSEEWKFYNAGEGSTSYAPFPADLIFPTSGGTIYASSTVEFSWEASDVDNDISDYELLLDTANPPTSSIASGITDQSYTHTSLSAGNIYYWQVLTTDEQGNVSTSEVSQFKVE